MYILLCIDVRMVRLGVPTGRSRRADQTLDGETSGHRPGSLVPPGLEHHARAFPFLGRRPGGGQVPWGFPAVTGGGLLVAFRVFLSFGLRRSVSPSLAMHRPHSRTVPKVWFPVEPCKMIGKPIAHPACAGGFEIINQDRDVECRMDNPPANAQDRLPP